MKPISQILFRETQSAFSTITAVEDQVTRQGPAKAEAMGGLFGSNAFVALIKQV